MRPPITPVGLDYISGAAKKADIDTEIIDLCLENNPEKALKKYFNNKNPELVGLSFRNVDDCFWPSAQWFVPNLGQLIDTIRSLTDAPIVIGGIGFSIFAEQILNCTGADFGIRGDGEQAIVQLYQQLHSNRNFPTLSGSLDMKIDGLLWKEDGKIYSNKPAWPKELKLDTSRESIDNAEYFKRGGQCGIETKRGCNRNCLYCADPIAKGTFLRTRAPADVADEIQGLVKKGIDVFHICDSEFNVPGEHAYAVCEELVNRRLGRKIKWYTYMSITPFDSALASIMRKAGCVGIDFTTDAASPVMLRTYRHKYFKEDISKAVKLCRDNKITVMTDLLLGGPGETPQSLAETIAFMKKINPDCVGSGLGVRIYPGTGMERIISLEGQAESNPNIKRKYTGPIDLLKPTFYISQALGERPAVLVRDLIGEDNRFFPPDVEPEGDMTGSSQEQIQKGTSLNDHNYNENLELVEAISKGARGAFWDILRKQRMRT
jgi:radical SAM superfamily enzyme YgiQ (UPF0313 family)